MTNYRMIYITCNGIEQATHIGKTLVKERLAACANCISNMKSFYNWDGSLQEDEEAILILKTEASLVNSIITRVKALHSYENPCIVSYEIKEGSQEYLNWIHQELFENKAE